MIGFLYREAVHIKVIPVKRLFHSTTVHEVVNRGDIFAVNLSNMQLTIVPAGSYPPISIDTQCQPMYAPQDQQKSTKERSK